jgi:predicted Rossmann-fold nucleotide-binding protein
MKVLVCGGRNFYDWRQLEDVLYNLGKDESDEGITQIIQGGAHGADSLAEQWAIYNKVDYVTYDADWAIYGPSAGPIRNKKMLEESKPDYVVAFSGGAGTQHMIKIAKEANVPVKEVK